MPRKAPARVRRERTQSSSSPPASLPRALAVELERTGRRDVRPERIAAALAEWRSLSRQPRRELSNASNDYTTYLGPDARDVLDAAAHALPHHLARLLRRLIAPFDRAYAAKTLPDPFADPALPWWRRRIADLYQGRALTPRERDHAYQQAGLATPPP